MYVGQIKSHFSMTSGRYFSVIQFDHEDARKKTIFFKVYLQSICISDPKLHLTWSKCVKRKIMSLKKI